MRKNGSQTQKQGSWEKTKYANLRRYRPSGTLFAHFKVRGKLVRQSCRQSLETSDLALGHRKLLELQKEARAQGQHHRNGKLTFAGALEEFRQRGYPRAGGRHRPGKVRPLKPRTKSYYEERIKALLKSWPGLEHTPIRRLTERDCQLWADRFARNNSP
jgi:hypothetical protein